MIQLFLNFFSTDNKLFKKLFSGTAPIAISILLVFLSMLGEFRYFQLFPQDRNWHQFANLIIMSVLIVISAVSYAKHDKNVMKCTMGGLLAVTFLGSLRAFISDTNYGNVLVLIVVAGVFLSHIIINTDHHSNPGKVFFNQFLCTLLMLLSLIEVIVRVVMYGTSKDAASLAALPHLVLVLAVSILIVCVETNLDNYRIAREAKGWTEKK